MVSASCPRWISMTKLHGLSLLTPRASQWQSLCLFFAERSSLYDPTHILTLNQVVTIAHIAGMTPQFHAFLWRDIGLVVNGNLDDKLKNLCLCGLHLDHPSSIVIQKKTMDMRIGWWKVLEFW